MSIDRRTLIRIGGASLASAVFAACDSKGPEAARGILRTAALKNEGLERLLLRHTSMDHAGSRKLAGNALPAYHISDPAPEWDEKMMGIWRLDVSGAVRKPLQLTLKDIEGMKYVTHRVNHYCVEGWTAVTEWRGVRLSDIARAAGVTDDAQYVDFQSFDSGYHESWDMESAMHPQTLLTYALEGHYLGVAHGAPVRVHSPVKLGYKNVKYLTKVVFMPNRNGGYWSDRGYEWYAGT